MSSWRDSLLQGIGLRAFREVPIERVRSNMTPIAEAQGFGGERIERFPGYQAFRYYLEDPDAGRQYFRDWYRAQVFHREIWRYSKELGGMATGSLAKAVVRLEVERGLPARGLRSAPQEIIEAAIEERIEIYFRLLESIRKRGFQAALGPPIRCWPRRGTFILINGHHRTAALCALGETRIQVEIDRIFRIRHIFRCLLRRLGRNIDHVEGTR